MAKLRRSSDAGQGDVSPLRTGNRSCVAKLRRSSDAGQGDVSPLRTETGRVWLN